MLQCCVCTVTCSCSQARCCSICSSLLSTELHRAGRAEFSSSAILLFPVAIPWLLSVKKGQAKRDTLLESPEWSQHCCWQDCTDPQQLNAMGCIDWTKLIITQMPLMSSLNQFGVCLHFWWLLSNCQSYLGRKVHVNDMVSTVHRWGWKVVPFLESLTIWSSEKKQNTFLLWYCHLDSIEKKQANKQTGQLFCYSFPSFILHPRRCWQLRLLNGNFSVPLFITCFSCFASCCS